MSLPLKTTSVAAETPPAAPDGVTLARLVGWVDRQAMVLLPGRPQPVAAPCLCRLSAEHLHRMVAVMFTGGDPESPVVIGPIANPPGDERDRQAEEVPARLELAAREEVVLRCGSAVLRLLADGLSSKDIASGLTLSVKTVDAHKYNLMRKLDIHNRAGLVKYAIRKKLVQVSTMDGGS